MNSHPEKSFEKAYAEFADQLFRFALYKVSEREEAMDITHDTFIRYWQALERGSVKEPRAYLYTIMRHLIIDWYRKKKGIQIKDMAEGTGEKEVYLDMFPSERPGAEIESEAKLLVEKIRELDPIYREPLYLRYVDELPPREIADILGESPNLISVRINRGMKLLKEKLKIE